MPDRALPPAPRRRYNGALPSSARTPRCARRTSSSPPMAGELADARGLGAHLLVGDLDSITPAARDALVAGAPILAHPARKDETDTELALLEAARRGHGASP